MSEREELRQAAERLRAWVRDFGSQKQPVFIADLNCVLATLDAASPSLEACVAEIECDAESRTFVGKHASIVKTWIEIVKRHWPTAPAAVEPSLKMWCMKCHAECFVLNGTCRSCGSPEIANIVDPPAVEPPKCDECDPSFTCWIKPSECRKPKPTVEPSEATALADQAEKFAARLTTDECKKDWLNLARVLRSQCDEIEKLQNAMNAIGDFSYKKLAEAVAEIKTLRTTHAEMVRRLEEFVAAMQLNRQEYHVAHLLLAELRSILAESAPKEKP